MRHYENELTAITGDKNARTKNSITDRLVMTVGTVVSIFLISGCGTADTPCSRTEDACVVDEPPPIDMWWDVPITDFSENLDRPTISLLGEKTQILTVGEDYLEPGATAMDDQDGDLSSQILITGQVDSSTIGDYFIKYDVTDSSGTIALEEIRIVRVIGTTAENLSRRPLGETIANFGYLEHLPMGYGHASEPKPPLLIYLHGGDGNLEFTNTTDPILVLDAVINNYGVPKLIEDGQWDESLPFVVLAPQLGAVTSAGYRLRLEAFLDFVVRTYEIDVSRIYLAGYSLGGFLGAAFSKDYPDRIAAVASVSPAFPNFVDPTMNNFCDIERVPLWLFHATNDVVIPFQNTQRVFNSILDNCQPTILPRFSLVIGAEHAIHHAVFNLEALVGGFAQAVYDPRYDQYDASVYEWLLSHSLENRE